MLAASRFSFTCIPRGTDCFQTPRAGGRLTAAAVANLLGGEMSGEGDVDAQPEKSLGKKPWTRGWWFAKDFP